MRKSGIGTLRQIRLWLKVNCQICGISQFRTFAIPQFFLLLFQSPTPSTTPVVTPLERMPALFTLIYVGGFAFVILLLLVGLIRNRRQPVANTAIPQNLPKDVRKRMGSTSTNRGLRALRWLFVILSLGLFGFHIYWARYSS